MRIKSLVFLLYATVSIITCDRAGAQGSASDKKAIAMLNAFYTGYMNQSSNDDSRAFQKNLDSIQKKYCTKNLLNKIKRETTTGELDYDPFLNAQDSDPKWLKTLEIKKDAKKSNSYIVSYADDYSKSKVIIHVGVINQNGSLKINTVR